MPETHFSRRLRDLRAAAGMTLQDLGDAAGLSRQRVHQLETGERAPSWAEAVALADAIGVSTDTFREPAG